MSDLHFYVLDVSLPGGHDSGEQLQHVLHRKQQWLCLNGEEVGGGGAGVFINTSVNTL